MTSEIKSCTVDDLDMEIVMKPKYIKAINEYLSIFVKPMYLDFGTKDSTIICQRCGKILNGFWGSFRWGPAAGEGKCSSCGWPCRAYHYPKLDGEVIFNGPIEFILQYRPKQLQEVTEVI